MTPEEFAKRMAKIRVDDSVSFVKGYEPPLDAGIAEYVKVLNDAGIETYESCEGGKGHSYTEPAIRFHGNHAEGYKALAVALQGQLPVSILSRFWSVEDGEPVGPSWQLTFSRRADA